MADASAVRDLTFRIHHTMLPVANLDRSIDFYTSLFGMKLMGRRSDPNRKVEVGHVGYGDRATQPSLELIQDVSSNAPAKVSPTGGHISIHVNDLQKLSAVLEKNGVEFTQPLTQRPGGNRRAWVRDLDGHELELAEHPPSA
jgi:lactoylglutathione lyase